jgi:hypothetical protein
MKWFIDGNLYSTVNKADLDQAIILQRGFLFHLQSAVGATGREALTVLLIFRNGWQWIT